MNKIDLLQERKAKIVEAGKEVRAQIFELIDENSFVETSAFSFSKSEFYSEEAEGEGVITGFATIGGYPFYIVAQNEKVLSGGITKANCEKICKTIDAAEKNSTPVIYLLNSYGVKYGEGVPVLEGLGKLLMRATQLKGVVPQYVIVNGEVYGSAAMLAAIADYTFFIENKSVLAINSPFVLSAKAGKNLKKEEVGGALALNKTGVVSFIVKDFSEVKDKIYQLSEIIDLPIIDAELNESYPALNENATVENILSIFENPIEVGSSYCKEVKTVLGRLGGIAVAAVIFDGGELGVELCPCKLNKISSFAEFASCYGLPFIVFDDVLGIKTDLNANNSKALKEAYEYLNILDTFDTAKISVVYKKAIGLGYSLFASKSAGYDYTLAFANAKIALFNDAQGAKIEYKEQAIKEDPTSRYADEKADPINAALDGYIDAVIEPQFVKQHLIASLQMLLK